MNAKKLLAAVGIAIVTPGVATAASTSTTFQVTATVVASCSVGATTLAFGTYDPLAAIDKDGTSTVNVTCNLLTPYTVKLDGGSVNTDVSDREMASGSDRLSYQLYRDTLRTEVWGDGTGGSNTVTGAGLGPLVPVPHVVYGRAPKEQGVPNGSYADTITVTLEF